MANIKYDIYSPNHLEEINYINNLLCSSYRSLQPLWKHFIDVIKVDKSLSKSAKAAMLLFYHQKIIYLYVDKDKAGHLTKKKIIILETVIFLATGNKIRIKVFSYKGGKDYGDGKLGTG